MATKLAQAQMSAEAALEERSQQCARDMRTLTASFRDAREELAVQGEQLREARHACREAERGLSACRDEMARRSEEHETQMYERSYLAAQLAGHASAALQRDMQALLTATGKRSMAPAVVPGAAAAAPTVEPTLAPRTPPPPRPPLPTGSSPWVHPASASPVWASVEAHGQTAGPSGLSSLPGYASRAGPVTGGVPASRRPPITSSAELDWPSPSPSTVTPAGGAASASPSAAACQLELPPALPPALPLS